MSSGQLSGEPRLQLRQSGDRRACERGVAAARSRQGSADQALRQELPVRVPAVKSERVDGGYPHCGRCWHHTVPRCPEGPCLPPQIGGLHSADRSDESTYPWPALAKSLPGQDAQCLLHCHGTGLIPGDQ